MKTSRRSRWQRRGATAVIVATIAGVFIAALYQPWLSQWGSTGVERRTAVVGDELVAADVTWTRSITIDAPPEAVWPWLEQMGVERGGFYNYDWGEQLFGDPVHNATTIHAEWQDLEAGDAIHPFPGQDWAVTALQHNRALVLTNPAVQPTDWSWATELRPLGEDRTRVVTRIRSQKGTVFSYLLDPPDLILFPRLLTGLKQRAEGTLPGMPGTHTGEPFPLARLPVHWWAALAWLAGLAVVAVTMRRVVGLGRWKAARPHPHVTLWGGFVAGAGYLLMSDTPPVHFFTHAWGAGLVLGSVAGLVARRLLPPATVSRRVATRALPALVETGVFVLLPATILWQAATARGWTTSVAAHLAVGALATVAATALAATAWRPESGGVARRAAFAFIVSIPYVLVGSGVGTLLAALVAEFTSPAAQRRGLRGTTSVVATPGGNVGTGRVPISAAS